MEKKKIDWGKVREGYMVREDGLIISPDGNLLSAYENGQISLQLWDGSYRLFGVAQVVAEAFAEKSSEDHKFVCFKDGHSGNYHADNLYWSTRRRRTAGKKEEVIAWAAQGHALEVIVAEVGVTPAYVRKVLKAEIKRREQLHV